MFSYFFSFPYSRCYLDAVKNKTKIQNNATYFRNCILNGTKTEQTNIDHAITIETLDASNFSMTLQRTYFTIFMVPINTRNSAVNQAGNVLHEQGITVPVTRPSQTFG